MFFSWPIVALYLDMGEDNFSVLFFFTSRKDSDHVLQCKFKSSSSCL